MGEKIDSKNSSLPTIIHTLAILLFPTDGMLSSETVAGSQTESRALLLAFLLSEAFVPLPFSERYSKQIE